MSLIVTYPIKTIFNQSGTYTSDQNINGIDASDVRSLIWGISVGSVTGGSGGITISAGFQAPDGNYYEMDRHTNVTGEQWFPINIPVVASTINIG